MFSVKPHLTAIGYDDYEEAELLVSSEKLIARAEMRLLNATSLRPQGLDQAGFLKDEAAQLIAQIALLGYDPRTATRSPRPRGRPRDSALPDPLPPVGTELRSILGDTYTVRGYGYSPRSTRINMVMYQFKEHTIARGLVNLFAGQLGNGEPIVTWPEDPRGLKPKVKVPLGKQRVLKKQDLQHDEHADPDRGWKPSDGPRRRGAY